MQLKKITLNFLPKYVMFYDWLETDHMKEYQNVIVYRVNRDLINDIINYQVRIIDTTFYMINKPVILSDSYNCIAILPDENGCIKLCSSLLLEDELKINDEIGEQKLHKFNYQKERAINNESDLRIVNEIKSTISTAVKRMEKDNDLAKVNYFYYELFKKKSKNLHFMIQKINDQIEREITEKEIYLYQLIKKSYKLV